MYKTELKKIADFILLYNKYLKKGYPNCMLDDEGNMMADLDNGSRAMIFPSDKEGDYFYIRQQRSASLADDGSMNMADTEAFGTKVKGTAWLVAVMTGADEMKLLENLVNTLGKYKMSVVKPLSILWDKEVIVRNELKGSEKEDIEAAVKRLKGQTIVAVQFQITVDFVYQNITCLQPPCK